MTTAAIAPNRIATAASKALSRTRPLQSCRPRSLLTCPQRCRPLPCVPVINPRHNQHDCFLTRVDDKLP
jgi:hypothetical protein